MDRGLDALEGAAPALRGVTPRQQARSEATFRALVSAGSRALEERDFDEMAIVDIARRAGVSVGAFYGRFENKEAFFSAIQEITVAAIEARLEAMLAGSAAVRAGAERLIALVARFSVGVFRAHRGFYVASSKHSSMRPGAWSPVRRLGHRVAERVAARLAPRLAAEGRPASEREIRVALQFMNGLLVNAVLNAPGPLSIDDRDTERYIARMLCSFFGLPARARRGR